MKRVTIHATICRFPSILWSDKNDLHGLFLSLCKLECGMEYIIVPLGDIDDGDGEPPLPSPRERNQAKSDKPLPASCYTEGEKILRNVMRQSYVTCAKKRIYLFEDIKADLNAVLIKPSEAFRAYATALTDKVDLKLLAKCVMKEMGLC